MDIILRDITIIFAVSTIVLLICARIKIPGILGYLITGLLIGPNGLVFFLIQKMLPIWLKLVLSYFFLLLV